MPTPPPIDKINFEPILFFQYMFPNGGLNQHRETHALFYYYLLARKAYEEQTDGIVYVGDPDPTFDYRQIFTSVAKMYGVKPEHMANCWKEVDYTCFIQRLPKIPETSKLRQVSFAPEIIVIH